MGSTLPRSVISPVIAISERTGRPLSNDASDAAIVTPPDGPSAGVTIAASLASLLTGRPVRSDVAMTGEITLRGKVLPVGGIKEKVLAARRAGIRTVILPRRNESDLDDIPPELRAEMETLFVDTVDEVLTHALRDGVGERPVTAARTEGRTALN